MREWLGLKKLMGSAHSLLSAFRGVYRGNSRIAKKRITAVAAAIYHIWNMRNRKLFETVTVEPEAILRKIQIMVFRNCGVERHEFQD